MRFSLDGDGRRRRLGSHLFLKERATREREVEDDDREVRVRRDKGPRKALEERKGLDSGPSRISKTSLFYTVEFILSLSSSARSGTGGKDKIDALNFLIDRDRTTNSPLFPVLLPFF